MFLDGQLVDVEAAIIKSNLAMGSKTLNMASYIFIGRMLTFIFTGIALIIVTRLLGPTQYGIYTLAIAFGGIFSSVGYFGIGTALNKFVSQFKEEKRKVEVGLIVSNALVILLISGIILAGLCVAFSGTLALYVFHTKDMAYLIDIIAVYIVSTMLFGAFYDTLIGFESGKDIAIVAVVEALIQATVSILLVFLGFGALAPIIGLIVGYTSGFILGFWFVAKHNDLVFARPSIEWMVKILGFSAPVAMYNVIGNLTGNIALIFLGYFVASSVIGNIGITVRTAALVGVIFDSMTFALLPAFSAAFVNNRLRKHAGRIFSYIVYLGVVVVGPVLFYVAILSGPFSSLIFGSQYTIAPLYIPIMSIGLLLGVAGVYASTLLISIGKVKSVFRYNVAGSAVALLLVIIFAPFVGGIAYIVTTYVVGPVVIDILSINGLSRLFRIDLRRRKLLGILAANVLISALILPMYLILPGKALLLVAIVVFVVLYPPLAVLTGGLAEEDINTIRMLSNSVPFAGKVLAMLLDYASLMIR